jgi:hydrogenase maturation protein HypF
MFKDELLSHEFDDIPTLKALSKKERSLLVNSMKSRFNSPMVYGIGRLFDAVASIIGIRQSCSFEAQAAMELEFTAADAHERFDSGKIRPYRYEVKEGKPSVVDWRPMLEDIIEENRSDVNRGAISLRFHMTLAEIVKDLAGNAGLKDIVLSGGVFQNALLSTLIIRSFNGDRFKLHTHSLLPPNDGCVSVGQCAVALAQRR